MDLNREKFKHVLEVPVFAPSAWADLFVPVSLDLHLAVADSFVWDQIVLVLILGPE
jgi:hypothetical protein